MATSELRVPDIGDFKEVEVIEILVKEGDTLALDQSVVTVESDKASMEIPATLAGRLVSLAVKLGDRVSMGSLLGTVESAAASSPTPAPTLAPPPAAAPSSAPAVAPRAAPVALAEPASVAAPSGGRRLLVLGAGPGGYSAAFRAADLGMEVTLVERHATLGGVCLNVGCIPSKALLHVAAVMDEVAHMDRLGVSFGKPQLNLDKLRAHKDSVISKLTGGLSGMAKARKVQVVQGTGRFTGPNTLAVDKPDGSTEVIGFDQAIVAAGSEAVRLPFLPDDPRVVTSTGALRLAAIPDRMLVIGGGIIGLEMATVYSTLGAKVDVVEMADGLMAGADRDLVKVWQKHNAGRFQNIWLRTKTVSAEARSEGIAVKFEGEGAPAEAQVYGLVLQAVGRRPNGAALNASAAGLLVDERGFIEVDRQMRTNVPHIYAIGDLVGQPMLAHKAVHEGHVAAEAAAGMKSFFDARVIPSVAYTDPEVAWVGITEAEAKAQGIAVKSATFPWAASGRAIANGRDEGFTKILVSEETHRVVGGGIVGTHAGEMIGEFALAVEMGCDPTDIAKTIHPHPTLGESIGMAAEVFEGSCTDLPPAKKR